MSKKKDQEKRSQWSWADSVHPKDVDNEHVNKAYRIGLPKCKPLSCRRNCKTNPYCLSGLGEQRWLQDKVRKPINDYKDPELERRQNDKFVGLKNLGATCYINSLLQLWFHNINFRKAIFNWKPEEDSTERQNKSLFTDDSYIPESSIGQLQLVFALMQFGKQRSVDPGDFITTLRINTSQQQDAHEFSNLYLSVLENKFCTQSDTSVRDMVKDNFLGEYKYVTTCSTCKTKSIRPSTFYELDLNIKDHKTLNDSLQEFLKEEHLTGDDQYYCNQCNSKQDAVRKICLTTLPPVLNIQLMRFVYDRQTMQKKKLNSYIQFSQTLDMAQYLNVPVELNASSKELHLYSLCAVLIHKGSSAYSGHYVAHIKDIAADEWYKINDENVEKLKGKCLNLCTEDEFKLNGTKVTKAPKVQKGMLQTNNAYMLVYMHTNMVTKLKTESYNWELSPRLTHLVDARNSTFENTILSIKSNREFVEDKDKLFVEKILNLITEMNSTPDEEEREAISLNWLTYWFKLTPDQSVEEINNSEMLCKHNLFNPDKVHEAKYIGTKLADKLYDLYNGGPRLKLCSSLCWKCVRNKCALLYTKYITAEENKSINSILQNWVPTFVNNEDQETCYWVGKDSLKCWRRMYLESFQYFVNDVDVFQSTTLPLNLFPLSPVFDSLKSVLENPNILESPVSLTNCLELSNCFIENSKIIFKMLEINDYQNFFCTLFNLNLVLKDFINKITILMAKKEEKNFKVNSSDVKIDTKIEIVKQCNNGHKEDDADDISPEEKEKHDDSDSMGSKNDKEYLSWRFNKDITCSHGNLAIEPNTRRLVPGSIWSILRPYFPTAPVFKDNTEPCHVCRNMHHNDEITKTLHREAAIFEKEKLYNLLWNKRRPVPSHVNSPYPCVSKYFLDSWRRFVRNPSKEQRPTSILNEILLCKEHNGLLFVPPSSNSYSTEENPIALLNSQEWDILSDRYEADHKVYLFFSDKGVFNTSEPDICVPCRQKRLDEEKKEQLKYSKAIIFIKVVEKEETDYKYDGTDDKDEPWSSNCPKKIKLDPVASVNGVSGSAALAVHSPPTDANYGATVSELGIRRSARNRRPRVELKLNVSSSDKLLDLKMKIMERFHVMPNDQHLQTSDGFHLCDNSASLGELAILPDSLIFAKFDEPSEDLTEFIAEEEAGFKGTELMG